MPQQNIRVRNLGSKGVISDLAPYDTPAEAWDYANNIRFVDGKAKKIGGSLPLFYKNITSGKPKDQIPMHLVVKPLSDSSWIYATRDSVWETNGWSHTKISEDLKIDVSLNEPWTSTVYANSIILNSTSLRAPIGKAASENYFEKLPKWGQWQASVIRSYKNFCMALNITEQNPVSGNFSQRVRWSNITPPDALPADWGWEMEEDSAGNPAQGAFIEGSAGGYNDLTMATGDLLDGLPLKDTFMLYTDKEVIACDYVGGNEVFRFRLVFSDTGILNTNCVAAFDSKHFVISSGDIYVHNGSTKQSVVMGKIKEKLIGELTENDFQSVKVITYEPEKEVWILYAGASAKGMVNDQETGETTIVKEATKAAIYNWQYDTWTFVDTPGALDVKFGPLSNYDYGGESIKTWETLLNTEIWRDSQDLWGGIGKDFKEQGLVVCSLDGNFYTIDQGTYKIRLGPLVDEEYTIKGEQILSTLVKTYLDLDDAGADIVGYKQVLALYPQVQGTGDFYFRVGGSHQASGSIEWGPRQKFSAGLDYKVDVRQNYRYLSIQIDNMTEGTWSLTGYDAVIAAGGRR